MKLIKAACMHVLTITNDATDLAWIKDPLTATGFSINMINAHSIIEASALLQSVKFDMVLYDLAFTDISFSDNLKAINTAGGKIPVVVLTEITGDLTANRAVKNGDAKTYMVKDRFQVGVMADSFKTILLKEQIHYN